MAPLVTYRLTAKNWDQLRNHMLCNRLWPTFTFTSLVLGSISLAIAVVMFIRLNLVLHILARCWLTLIDVIAVTFSLVLCG